MPSKAASRSDYNSSRSGPSSASRSGSGAATFGHGTFGSTTGSNRQVTMGGPKVERVYYRRIEPPKDETSEKASVTEALQQRRVRAEPIPEELLEQATLLPASDSDKAEDVQTPLDDMSEISEPTMVEESPMWHYYRISKWCIRTLARINASLFVVNAIITLAVIGLAAYAIYLSVKVHNFESLDRPCYWEWSDWSECSKTCHDGDEDHYPTKTRHVLKNTIVQPNGDGFMPCPAGLESATEWAYCNTYRCPIKMSSIDWGSCFYNGFHHVKMRNFTKGNYLVEIDTDDAVTNCNHTGGDS
ncbi:complement component C6 [Aphelenchoides avenae]|nr:complement component C6 [Aphelenchus avenae]